MVRSEFREVQLARVTAGIVREVSRDGDLIISSMSIDSAEPVLIGHFPGFPIFPGVCLVECVHQTALLALADRTDGPVLQAIERVRFLAPTFPGDEITIEARLTDTGDGRICQARVLTTRQGQSVPAAQVRLRYAPRTPAPAVPAPAGPLVDALDISAVKSLIPHRYPMLLLDRVEGVGAADELVGTKAVTVNEPCYARLDPGDDHAYPEVLLVESWCQAAGVLTMREHPNPDVLTGKVTLFGAITDVTLHASVQPGDVLRHHVRALKVFSDAAVLEGYAEVDGVPVMTVGQVVIALRAAASM